MSVTAVPAPKASPLAKKVAAKQAQAKTTPAKKVAAKKAPVQKAVAKKAPAVKEPAPKAAAKQAGAAQAAPKVKVTPAPADKVLARAKAAFSRMGKNRPTKLASLLWHLKPLVGQGATVEDADALSRRLELAKVIPVVGDLVLYP